MATKRKLAAMAPEDDDPIDPSDELMFLCLGGGNEVGRSCHIIQYKGKTVMVRWVAAKMRIQMLMDGSWMPGYIPHTRDCLACPSTMSLTSVL